MLSTTPLPIVLQMTTQQTVEPQSTENSSANKLPTEVSNSGQLDGESNQLNAEKHPDKEVNKNEPHKTPNDVEVFEQKPGPIKQNQEEEPEAAEPEAAEAEPEAAEAEPEAAEAKPEAAEAEPEAAEAEPEAAEAEPEPAAEPEAEPAPEPEPEENPEPEPEEAPESEPAAPEPDETPETEAEVKPEAEPEPEAKPETQPEEEMQNDAPAADETAPEATQATLVATDVLDNKDNNTKTCYSCNSLEEITCKDKPTTQMNCKIGDADKNGGHRGCYTIFKGMLIFYLVHRIHYDVCIYVYTEHNVCLSLLQFGIIGLF